MTLQEKIIALVPEFRNREIFTPTRCPDSKIGCCVAHGTFSYPPFTLADVLRAIARSGDWEVQGLTGVGAHVAVDARGFFLNRYGDCISDGVVWNLSEDLEGQSPETKAFLEKILI